MVTGVIGTKGANVAKDYDTNVRIPASASGLPEETVFLCFQMRSLDPGRFPAQPAGRLLPNDIARVEDALKKCLELR